MARGTAPRRRGGAADDRDAATRTRRVVVLLALGVVFALVLAPPLRLYVQQQQEIAAVRTEIAEREEGVAALEEELRLWEDEAYVAAQARERLGMVRPGEIGYVVPDPPAEAAAAPDPLTGEGVADALQRPDAAPEGTWYGRLWSSVEAVGAGAAGDPVLDAPHVADGEPDAAVPDGDG
jgi:cell division protein FtsB